MPATAKITADTSDYEQKIAAVKAKTVNASQEMSRAVNNFGKDVQKAGGVVASVSSEISGSLGQVGKVIGAVAAGPVAILTAAIGGIAAIGMKVWDQLTTSAEEYRAKMETQIDVEEKRLAKMREQQAEEDAYMERLKELSTQESLSNAEKEEAAFLIQTLSSRYNDFGATIDMVTGKITGLAEAEIRLNEVQKQQRIEALENAIQSGTAISNAAFRTQMELPGWAKYVRGWLTGENADAEEAYKAYSGMTLSGRRETALEMLNPENGVRTKDEIRFWQEELARLDKLIAEETELNNIRKYGTETQKTRAEEMKKASETEKKAVAEQIAVQKTQNDQNKKYAEEQHRADMAAIRDLEALKREQNARAKEQQSFRSMALRATGQGRQAAREEAVLEAFQRKGSDLNAGEYRKAVQFADARFGLENPNLLSVQDFTPRVNSLIARGGSDAPVSMPKIEDLQSQTLTNVKTIRELAARFLTAAESWGTF